MSNVTKKKLTGQWISSPVELTNIGSIRSSKISWVQSIPTNSTLEVYVARTKKSSVTPTNWSKATKDKSIPGLATNEKIRKTYVWIKVVMTTTGDTPSISDIRLTINDQIVSLTDNKNNTATVTAKSAGTELITATYSTFVSNASNISVTEPPDALDIPADLRWEGYRATWSEVDYASSYTVKLYQGSTQVVSTTTTNLSIDFTKQVLQSSGTYKFTVQATTTDPTFVNSSVATSGTITISKLSTPRIISNYKFIVNWDEVPDLEYCKVTGYHLELYLDNKLITDRSLPRGTTTYNYSNHVSAPGVHVVKLKAVGDNTALSSTVATSSGYTASRLPKMHKPIWAGTMIHWSPLHDEYDVDIAGYEVVLYEYNSGSIVKSYSVKSSQSSLNLYYDVLNLGPGKYGVGVIAIATIASFNSPLSELSEPIVLHKLNNPTNLKWKGHIATWEVTPTPGVEVLDFRVILWKGETQIYSGLINSDYRMCDFSVDINSLGYGEFKFSVEAIANLPPYNSDIIYSEPLIIEPCKLDCDPPTIISPTEVTCAHPLVEVQTYYPRYDERWARQPLWNLHVKLESRDRLGNIIGSVDSVNNPEEFEYRFTDNQEWTKLPSDGIDFSLYGCRVRARLLVAPGENPVVIASIGAKDA